MPDDRKQKRVILGDREAKHRIPPQVRNARIDYIRIELAILRESEEKHCKKTRSTRKVPGCVTNWIYQLQAV